MSDALPSHVGPKLIAEIRHYKKLAAALPHDDVKMDLPEGAQLKTEQGAWKIRRHGFTCVVGPSNKMCHEKQIELFNQTNEHYEHLISTTVTPVAFGAVRGIKHVQIIRDLDSKTVDYVLEVPGGFADVGILKRGLAWDEAALEQYFHTIQMIST